jgi:DNA primase small subunit
MLDNDFGFSLDELHVFFSGHRGYHVHVEDKAVRSLDAMARKEIVDYVTGLGLRLFEKERVNAKTKKANEKFRLHNFGWYRRLKLGMKNIIANGTEEDFKRIGVKDTGLLLEKRQAIIDRCIDDGLWGGVFGIGDGTWMKLALYVKNLQAAKIDTVVTTDVHRLIRMNGTLHGKTGLKKTEFPAKNLQDFDPFTGAVAFKKGEVKVLVSDVPEFRLGGETLGPYKNETKELPVAAAVMLICKGRAKVAN